MSDKVEIILTIYKFHIELEDRRRFFKRIDPVAIDFVGPCLPGIPEQFLSMLYEKASAIGLTAIGSYAVALEDTGVVGNG